MFMADWPNATPIEKSFYVYLAVAVLMAILVCVDLIRRLFPVFRRPPTISQLVEQGAPSEQIAQNVLRGAIGTDQVAVATRLEAIKASVAGQTTAIHVRLEVLRGMVSITVIIAVLSVVAGAIPAYKAEVYEAATSMDVMLQRIIERLTGRLSAGLIAAAAIALIATIFSVVRLRREERWQAMLARIAAPEV